jgi:uncharacterized protein (DUF1697 family)
VIRDGVHVALLRGINVGGNNSLPMDVLVTMFGDTGCREVQTYIQSGNVVFRASAALASRVPSAIAKAVERRFGFRAPIVMRTAAELAAVVQGNPFVRACAGVDEKALHVMFLADRPSAGRLAALDPDRSPGDAFEVHGRETYLLCPNGVARTKLTNDYFDTTLATTSTMRNWRTVLKLVEMTRGE